MKSRKINLPKLTTRKILVILTIFAFIVASIICAKIEYALCPEPKPLQLEMLYYSTQVLGSIFVTSGVLIAVWQYYLSSKSARTNLELIQVQRAVDLSEYYKDNILRYLQPISYIYKESGLYDILQKIKPEALKHFDTAEMESLLSEEDIKCLDSLTKSKNFTESLLIANNIYDLGLNKWLVKFAEEYNNEEENQDLLPITAFVGSLFTKVLNNMEFFAMHFSHRTADESVVYQSLHQTYLEIVHLLYFKIARENKASLGKYYTNVVWLYKTWITRQQEKANDFLEGMRNLTENGTVIEE